MLFTVFVKQETWCQLKWAWCCLVLQPSVGIIIIVNTVAAGLRLTHLCIMTKRHWDPTTSCSSLWRQWTVTTKKKKNQYSSSIQLHREQVPQWHSQQWLMYCCWWSLLEALLEKKKKKFCYLKFENVYLRIFWLIEPFNVFQYMNTCHVDMYHGVFRINAKVKAKILYTSIPVVGKCTYTKSIHARTLTNKHVHVGISVLHSRPHRLRKSANLSFSFLSYCWLIKCHFTGRFEIQLWSYSRAKGSRRGRPMNSFQLHFISFLQSKPEPWLFYFVSRARTGDIG